MQCPYCQEPLTEEAPNCGVCGLSLSSADGVFGLPPQVTPGISDPEGILPVRAVSRLRQQIAAFLRRFPQLGFTAVLVDLEDESPLSTYAFWLLNRAKIGRGLEQGFTSREVLLVIDTRTSRAALTIGYGLEPFVGRRHLDEVLGTTGALLAAGDWPGVIQAVLTGMDRLLVRIVGDLPRLYGLPKAEAAPREANPW